MGASPSMVFRWVAWGGEGAVSLHGQHRQGLCSTSCSGFPGKSVGGTPELAFCLCSSTASTRPFSLHSTPDWHLHTHLLAEQKFLLAVMSEVFREMYLGTEIDMVLGMAALACSPSTW